jgi:hypothetical protein
MRHLLGWYRNYRGGPMRRRAELVWLLDELLDRIPAWSGGRLYLSGQSRTCQAPVAQWIERLPSKQ